jgi:DNA-binding response OmpR family regulator
VEIQMPSAGSEAQRTVLLVDEDPTTGRLVRLSLHGPRCQVVVAQSYDEGISLAARHRPGLVLTEMAFKGATGLQLADALGGRAETQECAIAFLTREGSVEAHFRAIQLGAMAYLRKPVEGKRLGIEVELIFKKLDTGERPHPVTGPSVRLIIDTLRQVEEDATTGAIFFNRPGESAFIRFGMGKVLEARYGGASGDEALSAIAAEGDWKVELREGRHPSVETKPALRFNDPTDTSQTDPTLPVVKGRTEEEDLVETVAERPPLRSFAPESALGSTLEEDPEEQTMVDPCHPLLGRLSEVPASPSPGLRSIEAVLKPADGAPIDLTTTEEFFDEDVQTPLQFAVDEPSFPTAPDSPALKPAVAASPLSSWLQVNRTPLLVIVPNDRARMTLTRRAEQLGFKVLCAETGREGYASAIKVRPVAVLADLKMPDMDARELVAAVRTDFMVRETPFLMLSGDELAARISTTGESAVEPIAKGLVTALMPRVQLYERLKAGAEDAVEGPVEPIGTSTLLRTLGAVRVSGNLRLSKGENTAEVVLSRGEIWAATLSAPQVAVGPLALMHLTGYEWQDFVFMPRERMQSDEDQVSLGGVAQLVEAACQQNNILLARIYKQGVDLDEVTLDRGALDLYLQALTPDAIEWLIRLVEGEPAASLVTQGAPANLLRSMVFDLRRRGVVHPTSLRPVRIEHLSAETRVPPVVERRGGGRRWLVVLVAGFTTVLLAAGGYLVYWHFLQ